MRTGGLGTLSGVLWAQLGWFSSRARPPLPAPVLRLSYLLLLVYWPAADRRGGEVDSDCYSEVKTAGSKPPAAVSTSRSFFLVVSVLSSAEETLGWHSDIGLSLVPSSCA